jgi:hypothetical protein
LSSAAFFLYHSAFGAGYNIKEDAEIQVVGNNLQSSINTELIKLNSPHRCNLPPNLRVAAGIDCPAGMEGRSFWEWLDLPEDLDVAWGDVVIQDMTIFMVRPSLLVT